MNEDKKTEIHNMIKKLDGYKEKLDIMKRELIKEKLYIIDNTQAETLETAMSVLDDRILVTLHGLTDVKWELTNIINKLEG